MRWRDIAAAVAAYLAGIGAFTALSTLIGSFVLAEWWTPLSTVGGRASVAWLSLTPVIYVLLGRRL